MEKKRESIMKPLEEMDLIDDFLFTEVMTDEENGQKACRIILETVLKRKLGEIRLEYQKVIPGVSESSHGIRLDTFIRELPGGDDNSIPGISIYDIEPDKRSVKKDSLPKRARYYGDLVDVQLLETSVDYEKLPEQVTIFILSYDPFGKGSMYYEARTMLITHPDTAYNDGVRRIFLYADGNLPEESAEDDRKIQKLLKYIARSTDDNISDESTVELDRIVRNTKSKKEVGVKYMKSWEREKELIEDVREEERKNTEAERRRADEAEKRAESFEKQVESFEKQVESAEKRAESAEKQINSLNEKLARYIAKYGDVI